MRQGWAEEVDWVMLGALTAVGLVGVATIHSAGRAAGVDYAFKQAWWLAFSIGGWFAGFHLDHRLLQRSAYTLYGGMLLLLLVMPLIGSGAGTHRWIVLGPLSVQPSEFAKPVLLLALGRYFQDLRSRSPFGLTQLIVPLLLVMGFAIPVALQPDLGSAVFLVAMSIPVLVIMGIERWTWVFFGVTAAAATPALFFSLRPYQRARILTFLDPGRDPLGAGYHVVQSKIAIGSGGLAGKGYLEGTQTQLRFLPEQHTDFAFSVFAEEWGFVGCLFLIGAMVFLTYWAATYYKHAQTRFAVAVVMGVPFAFAGQALINLGMTSGILPVVGIPLPLISYGGSSLLVTFFGFGLVAGFHRRAR